MTDTAPDPKPTKTSHVVVCKPDPVYIIETLRDRGETWEQIAEIGFYFSDPVGDRCLTTTGLKRWYVAEKKARAADPERETRFHAQLRAEREAHQRQCDVEDEAAYQAQMSAWREHAAELMAGIEHPPTAEGIEADNVIPFPVFDQGDREFKIVRDLLAALEIMEECAHMLGVCRREAERVPSFLQRMQTELEVLLAVAEDNDSDDPEAA